MANFENQYQNDERLIDLRIQLDTKLKKYLQTKNESNEENIPLRDFLREINSLSISDKKIYRNYVGNIMRGLDDSFIKDTSDDLKQLNKLDLLNAWRGIENSIKNNYQSNSIPDSNDIYREQDIVFAGGSIQEKVKVIKNFKFNMKDEMRNSPISGEIIELGNNVYELKLSRIDYDGIESGEILKLRLVYNNYGNTVQIFDEYRSRLIGEQIIHFPRNGHRYNDSRAPSTQFNIKPYGDKGPLININLAFPNR